MQHRRLRDTVGLIAFVALCFGTAGIGSWLTTLGLGDWYEGLVKPSFTPPGWIFGPVWSALYLMMAVAAWLVWRRQGFAKASGALGLFGVQLALNVAWSGLFFAMQSPGAAMVDIVLLWLAILATLVAFARHSATAAWLLVPYLAWVSFAAVLNFALWRLN